MSTKIPSKLRVRHNTPGGIGRGIGAGVAANMALMGIEDPEAAARIAAMSPEEFRKLEQQHQAEVVSLKEAAEKLLGAQENGQFNLSRQTEALAKKTLRDETLSYEERGMLLEAEVALQKILEEEVDTDIDGVDAVAEAQDPFRIEADDPAYEPVRDRERRLAIESRLAPLDFDQMVFQGYVEQDVPVRDNLTYRFRSISSNQTLWLEELASKQRETSPHHLRHWFSLAQVATSLVGINGREIPPRLGEIKDKEHFWKALEQRMETLGNYPSILTDDMIVQFVWFWGRQRKNLVSGSLVKRVGNS